MATLPFSIQPRNGETVEQLNKRVQKARAEFIKQHRPVSKKIKRTQEQRQHAAKPLRRRGAPDTYTDVVATTIRAMWVAGMRIRSIAALSGVTENTVRYFCQEWDKRPACIPTLSDVQLYRAYQNRLPKGPKLDARMQAWVSAVAVNARATCTLQS